MQALRPPENPGIVCPWSPRACNINCRAYIRNGNRCGVLEWMKATGIFLENIAKNPTTVYSINEVPK